MYITNVRINGIKNPLGYTYERLSCSWNVKGTLSKTQEHVLIEVSDTQDFQTILYKKEGKELKQSGENLEFFLCPRTIYYYRITVTGDNKDVAVSEVCTFETGKMNEIWKANWISPWVQDTFHPVLIKRFSISKKVKKARLYITGVGLFEAFINGKKIGEELLTPYMSNYEKHIQVITFVVEDLLKEENMLEIFLAKGWYMGVFGLNLQENQYGNRMAAIAELHLEYEDTSKECICTDGSFNYKGSDIEDSGIYDGEIYNRLFWEEKENIEKPVEILGKNLKMEELIDRISLPIIEKEEIKVQQIIHTPAGETVLDMGQNFTGYMVFEGNLPKGTKVILDFGEILQEGNFYNKNYRDAKSQFIYISNGENERVRPHFTFFGFRYVRVTGWVGELKAEQFSGKVIYSDIVRTGFIETADEKINRLYENTIWGLKSNYLDIPMDCPQRSERLGWTGDAQVFAPTACYHMDTRAFFHKFIKDLREEQKILKGAIPNFIPNPLHKEKAGSVWGDVSTLLPNTLFDYYGDLEEIKSCYPLMKDWVDYMKKQDNFPDTFGDWLALDGSTPTSFKGSTDDNYISYCYYYRSVQIVGEMAKRLEKQEDSKYYNQLEEEIRQEILREFFTPNGRLAIDTQAAYVIALKFGLFIDKERLIGQFKDRLQKDLYQIKCGFVGAPLLCTVLGEAGLYQLAYDFLLKEDFPSWLYSVNMGATTIWERWNSVNPDGTISDTGMNSLNHYAYGSVMEFVYGYVVGIRALEPGFKKAVIAPHPDIRLPYVNGRYDSVNGSYVCNWSIKKDGMLKVHIEIPFNCEAQVKLPEYEKGKMVLGSGVYDFVYKPKRDLRKPYSKETTLVRISSDKEAMAVLTKYTPALAGIAASQNAELGVKSLEEISHISFLPFDPEALKIAIEQISQIKVIDDK